MACRCRRPGFSPRSEKVPWGGHGKPLVVLPENHGQRPGGPQPRISKGRIWLKPLNTHRGGWFKCWQNFVWKATDSPRRLYHRLHPESSSNTLTMPLVYSLTSTFKIEHWSSLTHGALEQDRHLICPLPRSTYRRIFYGISLKDRLWSYQFTIFEEKCPALF